MSEFIPELHIEDDYPEQWECGGCGAYWFKEPEFKWCPFCHQDCIYPVYGDEFDYPDFYEPL